MAPLRATYRLQFHRDFTFRDALELVPYLAELGISHIYASPITEARPGSTHGYDIVDHNRLNPEIGSEADFQALVAALQVRGMGLILDIVPNHMGIGPDNAWWLDARVGAGTPYAPYFDIDWDAPRPDLTGRVRCRCWAISTARSSRPGRSSCGLTPRKEASVSTISSTVFRCRRSPTR